MLARIAQWQPDQGAAATARAVGALALAALAVIHVVDLPGTLGPDRLVGIGYLGIIAGAILVGRNGKVVAPRLFGQSSHEVTLAAAEPADTAGTTSRERKIFWIVIAAAAVVLLLTLTRLLRGVSAAAS